MSKIVKNLGNAKMHNGQILEHKPIANIIIQELWQLICVFYSNYMLVNLSEYRLFYV